MTDMWHGDPFAWASDSPQTFDPVGALLTAMTESGAAPRNPGDIAPTETGRRYATTDDNRSERSGWYWLRLDADGLGGIGYYQNHKAGGDLQEWSARAKSAKLTPSVQRERQEATARAKARQAEDRAARTIEAATIARRLIDKAEPGETRYTKSKGVDGAELVNSSGQVVIPTYSAEDELTGAQIIASDGSRRYITGTPAGASHGWAERPTDAHPPVIVIAEGWATGRSIATSTGWPVAIAFSAANLPQTARTIARRYPGARIIIGADHDQWTGPGKKKPSAIDNPGMHYAKIAAAEVGAAICAPTGIPADDKELATDWNDVVNRPDLGNGERLAQRFKEVLAELRKEYPRIEDAIFPASAVSEPDLSCNYLIKGLINREGMSILYAPSNVGKTFVALSMGLAIAAGSPDWHGHRVAQANVLYVASETGVGLRNRIYAAGVWSDQFLCYPGALILDDPIGNRVEELRMLIEARDIGLVIFDTLARNMVGDENSSQDVARVISAADAIKATGAHVMLVHHSGKDSGKGARGSSAIRAAVDTEIALIPDEEGNGFELTSTKQRDAAKRAPLALMLETVELGTDADGDPVTSARVVTNPDGASKGASMTAIDRDTIGHILELIDAEGKPNPGGTGWPEPSTVRTVENTRAVKFVAGKTGMDHENGRQTIRRIISKLINSRLIAANDGKIWVTTVTKNAVSESDEPF